MYGVRQADKHVHTHQVQGWSLPNMTHQRKTYIDTCIVIVDMSGFLTVHSFRLTLLHTIYFLTEHF